MRDRLKAATSAAAPTPAGDVDEASEDPNDLGYDSPQVAPPTLPSTGRWLAKCPGESLAETWTRAALTLGSASKAALKQEVRLRQVELNAFQTRLVSSLARGIQAARVVKRHQSLLNGLLLDRAPNEEQRRALVQAGCAVREERQAQASLDRSVPYVSAPLVWELSDPAGRPVLGEGIRIGILDTGVDYLHPDFGGCDVARFRAASCRVAGGYDFVAGEGSERFLDPMDDFGHGTHVASIAAGSGRAAGNVLEGVAPRAKIYAYKVLNDQGAGAESAILSGMERAADPNGDLDFSDRLDVVNMSFGSHGNPYQGDVADPDDSFALAVDRLSGLGVACVVAAGNAGYTGLGFGTVASPGTARTAITVGANGHEDDLIAGFSSKGPVSWTPAGGKVQSLTKPDLLAPGVEICAAKSTVFKLNLQSCADSGHASLQGTSMSAPHVAGAVALLRQLHPSWTPAQLKQALKNSAIDTGASPFAQGAGRMQVAAAAAFSTPPPVIELGALRAILSPTKVLRIPFAVRGAALTRYAVSYGKTPVFSTLPTRWKSLRQRSIQAPSTAAPLQITENLDPTALGLAKGYYWIEVKVTDAQGRSSRDLGRFTIR